MRKIKSIMSIVLCLCILSITTMPSEAVSNSNYNLVTNIQALEEDSVLTQEDIQLAREAYSSLTPKAKQIFENSIANDPELLTFHQKYVDKSFVPPSFTSRMVASASAMDILRNELNAIGLPSQVKYALEAMGAGMVAALGDGALPVGDILLAAATVAAAAVIAANWGTVSLYTDDIIDAFKKAFSSSVDNVIEAFDSIFGDAKNSATPTIVLRDNLVKVDGTGYYCRTKAEDLNKQQTKNKKYFVAVLLGANVYVDATHSIDTLTAKAIMYANNRYVGVWATDIKYARGLVGAGGRLDIEHKPTEGYFPHYHHAVFTRFHCWFLSF